MIAVSKKLEQFSKLSQLKKSNTKIVDVRLKVKNK